MIFFLAKSHICPSTDQVKIGISSRKPLPGCCCRRCRRHYHRCCFNCSSGISISCVRCFSVLVMLFCFSTLFLVTLSESVVVLRVRIFTTPAIAASPSLLTFITVIYCVLLSQEKQWRLHRPISRHKQRLLLLPLTRKTMSMPALARLLYGVAMMIVLFCQARDVICLAVHWRLLVSAARFVYLCSCVLFVCYYRNLLHS